ncbi:MAG: hypothetical protein FWD57_08180, partial [Polyangiaceae bacterium]|nr:hypothetical protein [Polyangiaceae bacterium]
MNARKHRILSTCAVFTTISATVIATVACGPPQRSRGGYGYNDYDDYDDDYRYRDTDSDREYDEPDYDDDDAPPAVEQGNKRF